MLVVIFSRKVPKARSCQSICALHTHQRDVSAFHRLIYKRPVANQTTTRCQYLIILNNL